MRLPEALADDKRERLLEELRVADNEACSFERLFEERLGRYAPDEYSGFRKLNTRRLFNVILFFCVDGQLKTKLNKLLFYADFKHFKENTISITGARYCHLQYGPVPDNYDYYFAELERARLLDVREEAFGGYTGFECITRDKPDLTIFGESELVSLVEIKDYFKDFGSARIMEFSHEEAGYVSTKEGEPISYLHAQNLRI
ncbi:MAG: Panacea domain-containing protein [Gammaproteobacteria bacterium]|nr:Panacea domain-containing protein [Gammaproteobacteria bacterium]